MRWRGHCVMLMARWEQRNWGITYPLQALSDAAHPLLALVQHELAQMQPAVPEPAAQGYVQSANPTTAFVGGAYRIAFNTSGAVDLLENVKTGRLTD